MGRKQTNGKHYETLLRKYLEKQGWIVHQAVSTGVKRGPIYTSQTNDVYGVIDLVCKHPKVKETYWIQVTSKAGASQRINKIKEANIPWKDHDEVIVAAYYQKGDLKEMPNGPFYQLRSMKDDFKIIKHDLFRLPIKQINKVLKDE